MDDKIQLLRRYLNGTYQKSEVDTLHDVLCKEEYRGEMDSVSKEAWEDALALQDSDSRSALKRRKEALDIIHQYRRRKRIIPLLFRISSAVAAIVFLFLGISYFLLSDGDNVRMLAVRSSFGEKKEVLLPDGSYVVLNSCSSVEYPERFNRNQRALQLTGEAFFKVAPDENRPFTVKTQLFDVVVLGTEFNIKSYQEDKQTSVEVRHGRVQVNLPEEQIRLRKDQKMVLDKKTGEFAKQVGDGRVATWMRGTLHFHNTPIEDVAHELERRFHCRIVFEPTAKLGNRISGEHEQQDLESILQSIAFVCGIKYRIENEVIILYK